MTVREASGKLNKDTKVKYEKLRCFKSASIIIRNRFLFRLYRETDYLGTILDSTWITKPKEHVVRLVST